jgi:hypothetical protein
MKFDGFLSRAARVPALAHYFGQIRVVSVFTVLTAIIRIGGRRTATLFMPAFIFVCH